MSNTAPSNTNTNIRYIYDLPYEVHQNLGLLLDPNDQWKDLGGIYMKFGVNDLDRIGKAFLRKESPTEDLLKKWGNQNHTVFELFVIMNKMKQYQAMKILQPYVDEQYHRLIFEGVSRMEIDFIADKLKTMIEMNSNSRNTNPGQSTRRPVGNQPLDNQGSPNNTERSRGALDISELGSGLPFIDYEQLTEGTKNWHKSNFLGRGGFGVVFRGVIKQTTMAIKRLEPQKGNELEFNALEAQRQQLFRELKYLNNNRHDNVLPLYGYSFGEDKYCLVYQFMPNGSLEDRIQCRLGTPPLQWYVRYNIARGTARGIQFLHSREKPLVHGDIKSANILLDQCMEPKIGDFGLAREGPTENYTHVKVSRVHGTRPYLPDEFLRGKKFSTKVDTYSFGVVLFEIATGLRAYDEGRREKFLRDFIYNYNEEKLQEVIDPKIGSENFSLFKIMIELGKKCVVQRPKTRPEMTDVSMEIDRTLGDIDSLLRASHQRMMNSLRFDLTGRRQSLIPATGSYHPEPWMYATPPASIPVSIQPPPVPNRQSPSPTNPAVTVPGLPEVSEENANENVSNVNFEFKTPTIETSVPNFQGVPNIVFTPADKSVTNAKSSVRQVTSSVSDSDSSSYTEESREDQPVCIRSEIEMNNSDSFLPMVSLLQKRVE